MSRPSLTEAIIYFTTLNGISTAELQMDCMPTVHKITREFDINSAQ